MITNKVQSIYIFYFVFMYLQEYQVFTTDIFAFVDNNNDPSTTIANVDEHFNRFNKKITKQLWG